MNEAIAFDVTRFAACDGRDQCGQVGGVHLAIAGHDDECVAWMLRELEGAPVSGDDGCADAAIMDMPKDVEARVAAVACLGRGVVAARVVDDDDAIHLRRHGFDDARDARRFFEGRNHHHDARAVQHDRAQPMRYEAAVGKKLLLVAIGIAVVVWGGFAIFAKPFPSDHTPEGAYMRIAKSVGDDAPREIFAYLETDAQWASYTIRDKRAAAVKAIDASYPEPQRSELASAYRAEATAPDGADIFVMQAKKRGWIARLRKDMSGVARVEVEGERASVVTARGTRYPFRVRDNGIWGLTIFTGDLIAESERATRDLAGVESAAADYARAQPK